MKWVLLAGVSSVLLGGCDRSNTDNAKIDALSQKLDTAIQNQATIEAKLANDEQMGVYFYTNQVNAQIFCASNLISALASDEQKSVDAINTHTFQVAQMNTIMILTNEDMVDMESDIEKIKVKLGIN